MKPLTVTQVTTLSEAALKNSRELVEDATLLLQNRRFPRALSLAILASEECGKVAYLAYVADCLRTNQKVDWKDLETTLRTHPEKLLVASVLDAYLSQPREGSIEDLHARMFDKSVPKLTNLGKLMGFYTDLDSAGSPHLPSHAISEEMADMVVRGVTYHLEIFEDPGKALPGLTPEQAVMWKDLPRGLGELIAVNKRAST